MFSVGLGHRLASITSAIAVLMPSVAYRRRHAFPLPLAMAARLGIGSIGFAPRLL